ncbi:uncharacterized protein BX663DRAFT_493959 [Cokeromyces recurvatus]|uniref:uncharacterized protein n=1 Tax=Cokeromyces recurvatus TaxID=90255 RepID=UPI00221EFF6D|nr:uncharacterized protein BX663DRAFT_493959 [Cokeromyces recurvatus]KAI7906837.1 hypothetical protein BX663DRAFT_493959 [Cokeromyces recurvatus]
MTTNMDEQGTSEDLASYFMDVANKLQAKLDDASDKMTKKLDEMSKKIDTLERSFLQQMEETSSNNGINLQGANDKK